MRQIFRGGETRNLAAEFAERKNYRAFLLETGYNFLDTLYEKSLYGFINRDYEVIAPVPDTSIFGSYAQDVEGLTFVVNQFNNFRNYYLNKAGSDAFPVPALIRDLKPRISYVDYETSYSAYIESHKALLLSKAPTSLNRRIRSFPTFIRFINDKIFDTDVATESITKSGFMLSPDASVYNTGIYIDLGQGYSVALDQRKADFINDEGFLCFLELANKFGFYVDGNYPWRLAVDLGSEYTQTLLMNGRDNQLFQNMYSDMFTMKVARDDYWSVVKMYKEMFVTYMQLINEPLLVSFSREVDPELWLETLLLAKFKELGLMSSPEQTDFFRETLLRITGQYRQYGLSSNSGAIGSISNFCAEQLKNKILGQP